MVTKINGTTGVDKIQNNVITPSNLPSGSVIQFKNSTYDQAAGTAMVSSTSTSWQALPLTITISPKLSTSKLFIQARTNFDDETSNSGGLLAAIYRDGVNLNNSGGYNGGIFVYNNPAADQYTPVVVDAYTDSTSTSSTTFTLYFRNWNSQNIRVGSHGGQSSIQVMEIVE
jgi:hypothetical protein